MENYIIVYGSVKDAKLQRSNVKKIEDVIVNNETLGKTITRLLKENEELKAENLKLKDNFLKYQSECISLFNKLNNNQEILVGKVTRLENTTATLLSNNSNQ